MQSVAQCPIGTIAIIVKVIANGPIKSRLHAMGIAKGNCIRVLDHTLTKQTWEVETGNTKIALRREEADAILVNVGACHANH